MDDRNRRSLVLSAGLFCAVLAVYAQTAGYGFSLYDDDMYVTRNRMVLQGVTTKGVAWALTTNHFANWHPITWVSHMVDIDLFGLHPGGHHAMNVFLHAGNSILLFWVLAVATGALWRSGFVAALFAVHPLHVESVAWIAERKDVLCTFFWMLALMAYVRYARRPSVPRYAVVVVCFCLGLMSKPMIVTLPFVLLLLDYWPLGRMSGDGSNNGAPSAVGTLLLEKLPLLFLSAIASWMTMQAQGMWKALPTIDRLPLMTRLPNAVISTASYLWKTVWPSRLAVFYPHPGDAYETWKLILALGFLTGVTILSVRARSSRPFLLWGWLWYLGTLFPVIGFVQAGSQALADRYTYVPLIGVFVAIAWAVPDPPGVPRWERPLLTAGAVGVLIALGAAAWVQTGYWRNDVTLFSHAARSVRGNWLAWMNLGIAKEKEGRTEEAIGYYRKAINIRPAYVDAHYNLGVALGRKGDVGGSIEAYRKALELQPLNPPAHLNLGMALLGRGEAESAEGHYREALRIRPDFPPAHNALGSLLASQGRLEEATGNFREAVRLAPSEYMGRYNLGLALLRMGKPGEAAEQFREALRARPEDPAAREQLAAALHRASGTPPGGERRSPAPRPPRGPL